MFHNVVVPSNNDAGVLSLAGVIEMAEGVLLGFFKTVIDHYTKLDRRLQRRAEGMLVLRYWITTNALPTYEKVHFL
jgi:hypothetical protein